MSPCYNCNTNPYSTKLVSKIGLPNENMCAISHKVSPLALLLGSEPCYLRSIDKQLGAHSSHSSFAYQQLFGGKSQVVQSSSFSHKGPTSKPSIIRRKTLDDGIRRRIFVVILFSRRFSYLLFAARTIYTGPSGQR